MASRGTDILEAFRARKNARTNWHDTWDEIADYLLPREGGFTSPITPGERLNGNIFDSTGPHALQIAASGLYSRASNPATKWFNLAVENTDLMRQRAVQLWLEDTRDRVAAVINGQLAEPLYQTYQSLLGFGTAALFIDEDPRTIVRGHAFKLKDIYLDVDAFGRINKTFREWRATAAQAIERFPGAQLSAEIIEAAKDPRGGGSEGFGPRKFTFIHFTGPRKGADSSRELDPMNMKFESVWIEEMTGNKLNESGFPENPYATPRLDVVPGEIYGRGPGLQAMPDVRTVNQLMYFQLDSAAMAIRPPFDVPEDAYASPLQLFPAAENLNQDRTGRRATAMFDTAGNLQINFQQIEERRASIRQIFFNDQLQLISNKQMTAFEVSQRQQQQQLLMGPWVGRLESELFAPMIDRVFGIMLRRGLLAPPPPQLSETEIKVTYESPLSRAQRQTDVAAIDRTMEFVLPLAQFGVHQNFDMDKIARTRAQFLGLPKELEKDEAEVLLERQQAAAQQQQQLQLQAQQQELQNQQLAGEIDQQGAQPDGA